jgi:transcriptional regulator GlxA family with amidase domain
VMERLVLERLARARDPRPHEGAAHAMALVARSGGRLRVRDLAAALGVGERRLEQLFHRHVGLSPKTACRLARFRAALGLLQREPAQTWSAIAHRAGYADQPHLAHEFRALAGTTPGAVRASLRFGFPQDAAATPR